MDIAKAQPSVLIAGQPYKVHYRLSGLEEIEGFASAPGRSFMEMAVGNFKEKAAIIFGGLKTKNKSPRNLADTIRLLEEHQEKGGEWTRVFDACFEAALYSGLGGEQHPDDIAALIRLMHRGSGQEMDTEVESGKEQAVKAAE